MDRRNWYHNLECAPTFRALPKITPTEAKPVRLGATEGISQNPCGLDYDDLRGWHLHPVDDPKCKNVLVQARSGNALDEYAFVRFCR